MSAPVLALVLSATVATGRHRPPPDPELAPIRAGVEALREGSRTDGTWGLAGNLIAAGIAISLAVVIGTDVIPIQDDGGLTKPLIVTALSIAAASQISEGLYNVLADPANVTSADELLADDEALDASGMFFLRDRARDGRDRRIRGIITDSTAAAGTAVAGGLLLTDKIDIAGNANKILGGIAIAVGGLQLAQALFKLFAKSTEEKVYDAVLKAYGEEPGGPALGLTIIPDRTHRAAIGAGVSYRF